MLKKKTVLLLKMTEKDSRHVFKKRSCNNIFIMKNNMYVLGTRGPYDEDGLIPSMDIFEEEYFYAISYLSLF